jgi:hypothetical protein
MMAYLVAAAKRSDLETVRKSSPETWRRVRRYNLPIQLALAAAEEVMTSSHDPAVAVVISLAPCQPGSADLYRWGQVVTSGMASGSLGDLRMNPTQTLHAVDNLAMSAFAITYGNHADCLGLGGAAGQAWCGLEAVLERLDQARDGDGNGDDVDIDGYRTAKVDEVDEALLMAGDQDSTDEDSRGLGMALLFSRDARPYTPLGSFVRLIRIERKAQSSSAKIQPHAATGLSDLVTAIEAQKQGLLSYKVPGEQTDGVSAVNIVVEISA